MEYLRFFLIFFIYSVIGYLVEFIYCSIKEKRLVFNRGFLIGPYLPIYGVGAVIMINILDQYKNDLLVLFIMSMVVCTIIEYITSFILEKIFSIRWWDYQDRKYNINGRVCLENSFFFGIAGVIQIRYFNPFINRIIDLIPKTGFMIISISLLVIFLADIIITLNAMSKIKISLIRFTNTDATAELKLVMNKTIKTSNFFITRIFNAFPRINLTKVGDITSFKNYLGSIKTKNKTKRRKS